MTIEELVSVSGRSYSSVYRQITKRGARQDGGEFVIPGVGKFTATKGANGWDIRRLDPQQGGNAVQEGNGANAPQNSPSTAALGGKVPIPSPRNLRELKTSLEIKKLRQQLDEGREEIEASYAEDFLDCVMRLLAPVPEAFRKCKLNQEQASIINAAFERSLAALKESIYSRLAEEKPGFDACRDKALRDLVALEQEFAAIQKERE